MSPGERDRRRALKDSYVREHGGAPTSLDRLLDDAARRARLRGPMSSLGFGLAQVGVIETCRVRDIAPGVLLEALAADDGLALLWRALVHLPLLDTPAFPAPTPLAPVPYLHLGEQGRLVLAARKADPEAV